MKHLCSVRLLVIILSLMALTSISARAGASCPRAFLVANFITQWNLKTAKLTVGTWQLRRYDGVGRVRQTLDGPSLLLVARVNKAGCITRASIRSRRADTNGFAALVAFSTLVFATNPTLSVTQRKAVLEAMKLDQPVAGGRYSVNGATSLARTLKRIPLPALRKCRHGDAGSP